jgi:hypothetical protein
MASIQIFKLEEVYFRKKVSEYLYAMVHSIKEVV